MKHERRSTTLIRRVKEDLVKRIRGDREGAPAEVVEILEVFEQGLFTPGFDLSDVRRACAPTPETERDFRHRFGGTFKSYATDLRLRAADELLARPDVPLPRIAPGLGFREEELFRRWLKRWTAATPEQRRLALTGVAPVAAAIRPPISLWFRARVAALTWTDGAALVRTIRTAAVGAPPQ